MLTTIWSRSLAITTLVTGLIIVVPGAAFADASCDPNTDPWCSVEGGGPGGGGNPGGGGRSGGRGCTWDGQTIPCQDPRFGSYVGDGCYWQVLNPPPLAPPPAGEDPTKGAWGTQSCYPTPDSDWVNQVIQWMGNGEVGPTPAELAQQALAKIHLLGAQIGVAPRSDGSGAVGLPVWLWTEVTPGTWGPQSASASGGGITVTITARASQIVWNMGDGQSVTCTNPGTPYTAGYGNSSSPTCGYRYSTASSTAAHPHGRYAITATTSWTVDWAGGGQTGVLNPTSQSQTSVEIGEIQVIGQ